MHELTLARALIAAAERALRPGGKLAVVSFHSLEDRIVKRFMQARSNSAGGGSRYAPETERIEPAFTLPFRRAIGPDEAELATNPRSRSALLRVGIRTHAPAGRVDPEALSRSLGLKVLPVVAGEHALIADALELGYAETVKAYQACIDAGMAQKQAAE